MRGAPDEKRRERATSREIRMEPQFPGGEPMVDGARVYPARREPRELQTPQGRASLPSLSSALLLLSLGPRSLGASRSCGSCTVSSLTDKWCTLRASGMPSGSSRCSRYRI